MTALAQHYKQPGLSERIHAELTAVRENNAQFDPALTGAFDQFHIGGAKATNDMLALADFKADDQVLDIGCGIGGPSRQIADRFGSHVTGLDLSLDYCQAASLISAQSDLTNTTSFVQANAIKLPFADASYDAIWTQHVTMNIADKPGLFCEFCRILRPSGKLVMYELVKTSQNAGNIDYPVPWSTDGQHSHLVDTATYRNQIEAAGFDITHWQDVSANARKSLDFLLNRLNNWPSNEPNLGLLLGDAFPRMMQNLRAMLNSKLAVFQILAVKPATHTPSN